MPSDISPSISLPIHPGEGFPGFPAVAVELAKHSINNFDESTMGKNLTKNQWVATL